jgi:hypothetical protein
VNAVTIQSVKDNMLGFVNDQVDSLDTLLNVIELAGDGNYLEIGVLHGGSLCAVALKKKALGHTGICYGVDPLDGYYMQHEKHRKSFEPFTHVPVTPEVVNENIKRFELDNVVIIQESSYPLSVDGYFSCVYIDGDHWGDGPMRDWQSVKDIADYVVFHDYDDKHPDIVRTCHEAEADPDWERYSLIGISFTLKRKAAL